MATSQAADVLGVSAGQVRELISAGRLAAVKVGRELLVDSESVRHRAAVVRPQPGRPLSARMAWALLWMASDRDPDWISAVEKVRARKYLRERDARDWPRLLAKRADIHRVRILPGPLSRLREQSGVIMGGVSAASAYGVELLPSGPETELYVSAELFEQLRRSRRIATDPDEPNVVLRVPHLVEKVLLLERVPPAAVVAADLLESGEERNVGAALKLLYKV